MTDGSSFEDLGLSPELVESLSADGYERPTALQSAVTPVLRRGNHVVCAAGSGSGILLAYASALLDRILSGESSKALVLYADGVAAAGCARSLAPVAAPLGVAVAALRSVWADPAAAQVLFGAPAEVLSAVQGAELKLDDFDSVVVVGAAEIARSGQGNALETLLERTRAEGLRAVFDLPAGPVGDSIAERFFARPVHIPPRSATGARTEPAAPLGKTVLYEVVGENRTSALLGRLNELKDHGRRVAVLFRTEDQVADVGDLISLYGYAVGEVSDTEASVWITTDAPDALTAVQDSGEPLTVIGYEAPTSASSLEAAANDSHEWLVFARIGELAHLRQTSTEAGVRVRSAAPLPSQTIESERDLLAARLADRLDEGGLAPFARLAESLLDGRDPIEVAAAALALASETAPDVAPAEVAPPPPPRAAQKAPVQSWSKLFVSVGERDGVRTGDLLGAVTNEASVKGSQVGRIDLREHHAVIEVDGAVADRVIKALNGTSIRGRSLRVDYDRSHRRANVRPNER